MQEASEPADELAAFEGPRYAYFRDLHVHTAHSMDAFQFGTLATPDDAYRYAKGEAIKHPAGFDMQAETTLIFMSPITAFTRRGQGRGGYLNGNLWVSGDAVDPQLKCR